MNSSYDAQYRLDLAEMFLDQARRRLNVEEWHTCVGESQVSVENAAKSIIVCFRPVPHTHDVADHLTTLIRNTPDLDEEIVDGIRRMITLAETHNSEEHVAATDGDENTRTPPWELFDENKARNSLADAEEACEMARFVFQSRFPKINLNGIGDSNDNNIR